MTSTSLVPFPDARVIAAGRFGHIAPTLTSRVTGWKGLTLESYCSIPGCNVPEHEHPSHFLSLLVGDPVRVECSSGGKIWCELVEPGTIYLLPRGTRDSQTWASASSRVQLAIDAKFLVHTTEQTAHLDDVELETYWSLRDRHIAALMRELQADLEDGQPAGQLFGEILATALSAYLLGRYAARRYKNNVHASGLPRRRLQRVLDFIEESLAFEIRLDDLAEVAIMSPHHFSELFRRSTGQSPHQYVVARRLERAQSLLRDTDFNILHIALAVGFADQSSFTKVFRRAVGVTPAAFRSAL
jgi:AraC family transcriptional regulator